jgi:hypothetical protein
MSNEILLTILAYWFVGLSAIKTILFLGWLYTDAKRSHSEYIQLRDQVRARMKKVQDRLDQA